MEQQQTYGALFIRHLAAIGRQTPFNYSDLQQIKAMSQTELADRMKTECPEFSQIVLSHTPDEAARLVHQRRRGSLQETETTLGLLDLLIHLFSISH